MSGYGHLPGRGGVILGVGAAAGGGTAAIGGLGQDNSSTTAPAGQLPTTGPDTSSIALVGAGIVAAGIIAVAIAAIGLRTGWRRRRPVSAR